jgi:hypothetical protein
VTALPGFRVVVQPHKQRLLKNATVMNFFINAPDQWPGPAQFVFYQTATAGFDASGFPIS